MSQGGGGCGGGGATGFIISTSPPPPLCFFDDIDGFVDPPADGDALHLDDCCVLNPQRDAGSDADIDVTDGVGVAPNQPGAGVAFVRSSAAEPGSFPHPPRAVILLYS